MNILVAKFLHTFMITFMVYVFRRGMLLLSLLILIAKLPSRNAVPMNTLSGTYESGCFLSFGQYLIKDF